MFILSGLYVKDERAGGLHDTSVLYTWDCYRLLAHYRTTFVLTQDCSTVPVILQIYDKLTEAWVTKVAYTDQ